MQLKTSKIATYGTRFDLPLADEQKFDEICQTMSSMTRRMLHEHNLGNKLHTLKNSYLKKYKIPARYFNGARIMLGGLIKASIELNKQYLKDAKKKQRSLLTKIARVDKRIQSGKERQFDRSNRCQFKRKLQSIKKKIAHLQDNIANKRVKVCFGGKKLFKKQYHLEENGYASHEQWYQDFTNARNKSFYLIGSKDETAGNQCCVATVNDNGNIDLKMRLPYFITHEKDSGVNPLKVDKYIEIHDLNFNHGHTHIVNAIKENEMRSFLHKKDQRLRYPGKYLDFGSAINFHFVKCEKSYTVYVTIEREKELTTYSQKNGVVAVDINQDHLAVANVSATGNLIEAFNLKLNLKHANSNQTSAIIGDAIAKLCKYANKVNKPLVIEELDFSDKKLNMQSNKKHTKRNYLLSSFAYNQIVQNIFSKAFEFGIKVNQVNPKNTSIIGRIKYAGKDTSISTHQAAALCIARKHLGFKEKFPKDVKNIPTFYGKHLSLRLLVQIGGDCKGEPWKRTNRALQAAARQHYLGMLDEIVANHNSLQQDKDCKPILVTDFDEQLPF